MKALGERREVDLRITFTESARSPDNPAHAMMLLDLVASGQATWSNAIEKLPMHVQGAAGLKRGLEAMDRGLEGVSPKMAAFIRKFTPDIQKMRDMEANLVREWLQKSGGSTHAIFEDKTAVALKISSELKKGYGV